MDGPKKTQGEKNSKLKEKTQNSSLKPKKSALFEKFRMFLCEKLQVLWEKHEKICQNSRKNSKLKEKTQNSRWKLKKSALLGSLGAGKASKKKACTLRPDANAQNVGSSGFMRPEPQAHPRDEDLEADTE